MFRNATLTVTNLAVHFGVATAIHQYIQKHYPEIYISPNSEFMSRNDIVKAYAKIVGVSVAVALVAGAVASVTTKAVGHIAFSN